MVFCLGTLFPIKPYSVVVQAVLHCRLLSFRLQIPLCTDRLFGYDNFKLRLAFRTLEIDQRSFFCLAQLLAANGANGKQFHLQYTSFSLVPERTSGFDTCIVTVEKADYAEYQVVRAIYIQHFGAKCLISR